MSAAEKMALPVKYIEGDFGMWSIECADCPLLPHAQALGVKGPHCAGGIATNMQGPVVLNKCQHADMDSLKDNGADGLTIGCRYAPEAT